MITLALALIPTFAQPAGFVPPLQATIIKACQKPATCGCPAAECEATYASFNAPISVYACFAELDCAATCAKDAGAPGSVAFTKCIAPEAIQANAKTHKAQAIKASCAHMTTCGCAPANCEATFTATPETLDGTMFACSASLPCATICAPNAGQPGGVAYETCIAPAMAKVQQTVQSAAEMQRRHHQTMMGIIGNMGATKQRVDIYDDNGQYLRTEER